MKTTLCVVLDCGKTEYGRGLCINHYQTMRYRVKVGHETWQTLEDKGLAIPAAKRGRKIGSIKALASRLLKPKV